MRASTITSSPVRGRKLHPLAVRIMHWTNAAAMLIMISSGWGIYNDEVLFGWLFFPPQAAIGSWAAPHLAWHFAAMWVLVLNGLTYLVYGIVTGRLRERLLPIHITEIVHDVKQALRLHLAHADLTVYNAVQKTLYIVVILAGIAQVVTGLVLWKPVQFAGLAGLFGSFQTIRLAHFAGMSIIVGFVVVHVALSLLVPQTLKAMLTGGPRVGAKP